MSTHNAFSFFPTLITEKRNPTSSNRCDPKAQRQWTSSSGAPSASDGAPKRAVRAWAHFVWSSWLLAWWRSEKLTCKMLDPIKSSNMMTMTMNENVQLKNWKLKIATRKATIVRKCSTHQSLQWRPHKIVRKCKHWLLQSWHGTNAKLTYKIQLRYIEKTCQLQKLETKSLSSHPSPQSQHSWSQSSSE